MKKTILLLLTSALLMGCGSTKPQIEVVTEKSTILNHQSSIAFDSIYVQNDHSTEYHPANTINPPPSTLNLPSTAISRVDTIVVRDKEVRYKYSILRDTINIHEVDSIPVIHEVEVVHTERYIPWFVRALAWIGALTLLFLFIRLLSNH